MTRYDLFTIHYVKTLFFSFFFLMDDVDEKEMSRASQEALKTQGTTFAMAT